MSTITPWLTWENVKAVADSAFITSLAGALAGAFAGALAAQRIAERSKEREQLLTQIRSTNAATMVSFSICNAALALKSQHVQPLHEMFLRTRKELEAFQQRQANPHTQGNPEFQFIADFRSFPAPVVPMETLKDLVFQRISAYGRPLALITVLEQALTSLTDAIAKRDRLIQRFASRAIPEEQLPHHYFGVPLPSGDINQEYPDILTAIQRCTDDLVFFSSLLCADLISHATRTRDTFIKRFGKGAPAVSAADFSGPRRNGLIPPEGQYADWLNGFKEQNADNESKKWRPTATCT